MSQQNNGNGNAPIPTPVSWATKAGYIGTGVLVGLVIYPFVRKAIAKLQPQMDKIFDSLTVKAEDVAERTSDLLARAKENFSKTETHDEEHHHGHSHGPVETKVKNTVQ